MKISLMNLRMLAGIQLCFGCLSFGQAPSIQWQKSFGGTNDDIAISVKQTVDGGFISIGTTYSIDGDVTGNHGGSSQEDCWILKLDNTGNVQWKKCFGGTDRDAGGSVQQTSDGGYIFAGTSFSNDGDVSGHHGSNQSGDFWVVKLDGTGVIQWQKSLGGGDHESAFSVKQTSDLGYIIAGSSQSNDGDVTGNHGYHDYWLLKLDSSGTIEWQKSFGGTGQDAAWCVTQTSDGGFIVVGDSQSNDGDITGSHGSNDCWIVKLDYTGNMEWQKSLGGTLGESGKTIERTNDGGYIVASFSSSNDGDVTGNHGYYDYWIVKLDSIGGILWQKSLGGTGYDGAWSIKQVSDNGYIVSGFTTSNDGDVAGYHGAIYGDYWIIKLDSIANMQWQKCLGGTFDDESYSIQQTTDGGYILSGNSQSNDGDVTGHHGTNQYSDFWIVKLDNTNGINESYEIGLNINIFPSPFTNILSLQFSSPQNTDAFLEIFNSIGESVVEKEIKLENQTLDLSALTQGIYFVSVKTEGGIFTEKIVK